MNWAIVIPVGIGIAVLLSIVLVAIGVSGQIGRKEEADEVRFYWGSMLMYSRRDSPDAPPDYEVKTLYENRKDFCAGCAEYNFCRSATMVYTHSPRRNGYPSRKSAQKARLRFSPHCGWSKRWPTMPNRN